MSQINIYIGDYSEKSIAVFGETTPFKDALASIGGKFNKVLKKPDSDERIPGWIFPSSKREKVTALVNDLKSGKAVTTTTSTTTTTSALSQFTNSTFLAQSEALKQKLSSSSPTSASSITVDSNFISSLLTRIEKLEAEVSSLKLYAFKSNSVDFKPTPPVKLTQTNKRIAKKKAEDSDEVFFSNDEDDEDEKKEEKKEEPKKSSGRLLGKK